VVRRAHIYETLIFPGLGWLMGQGILMGTSSQLSLIVGLGASFLIKVLWNFSHGKILVHEFQDGQLSWVIKDAKDIPEIKKRIDRKGWVYVVLPTLFMTAEGWSLPGLGLLVAFLLHRRGNKAAGYLDLRRSTPIHGLDKGLNRSFRVRQGA